MVRGKKGAEESNMIIFIILALVVAGLVIYFSWGFFSKGTAILDGTDPVVQAALQSCKTEMSINQNAWCTSVKYVPYAKAKQYMTCYNLNSRTGNTIEVPASISCTSYEQKLAETNYCLELNKTSTNTFKEIINGISCERGTDMILKFEGKSLTKTEDNSILLDNTPLSN